jgi:hypothetical protein
VDRLYATLKEQGIQAERNYRVSELAAAYDVLLVVPCRLGRVEVMEDRLPHSDQDVLKLAETIINETAEKGGVL